MTETSGATKTRATQKRMKGSLPIKSRSSSSLKEGASHELRFAPSAALHDDFQSHTRWQPRRELHSNTHLEREELLSIRLMPVLHRGISFAPTQSGLGLNGGVISVAPEHLLRVIRSIAAGATPTSAEIGLGTAQDVSAPHGGAPEDGSSSSTQQCNREHRVRVPFEVWLCASPWPMYTATFLLAFRFLLGIQIRAWVYDLHTIHGTNAFNGTMRLVAEVMAGANETLQDLGWTALMATMLLTIQNVATFESGLQDGFIFEGATFFLRRPARITRGFRTNTSRHRIERLQLTTREQLGHVLVGLGHSDQAALVADASAGVAYGPTLLTAGWVGCVVLIVYSNARVWPMDEYVTVCTRKLDNFGFMGLGADVCTFDRATAWAIGAGQIFARVCLYLAVRIDEVNALCNRAGAVQCLAIVEDIDESLGLHKNRGDTTATFTIREIMRLRRAFFDSKEAIEELHAATICLLVWLFVSNAWFAYCQPTSSGGIWSAAALQLVLWSLVATILAVLNEVARASSSLPDVISKEFPPSQNKEALLNYIYPNPQDWSIVANQPTLPPRKSTWLEPKPFAEAYPIG